MNYTNDGLPHINSTMNRSDRVINNYSTRDSLDENYKTYYYRIRGMDYFGGKTKSFRGITGYGYKPLLLSPMIKHAEQKENNTAYIEWDVHGEDSKRVVDFTILRSDTIIGDYEIVVDSIASDQRSYAVPMEYSTNYFRIEANGADGPSVSSTPVYVMGMDTIPPAVPVLISATIDSLGRVALFWENNEEIDFWGYRVYRAFFEHQEHSVITEIPIRDTFLIDTIDLNISTDNNMYYMIQSADKRNNRSEFTEPIVLTKPDLQAPASPSLWKVDQIGKTDSIRIEFRPSISRDVVRYDVYRRIIKSEDTWTVIAQVAALDSNYVLFDEVYKIDQMHGYTVVAIDDASLESGPCQFKSVMPKYMEKAYTPFKSIDYTRDEKTGEITFVWELNEGKQLKSMLVYRGKNKDQMGKYKLLSGDKSMTFKDDIPADKSMYYVLKPEFTSQKKAYYSESIFVEAMEKGE